MSRKRSKPPKTNETGLKLLRELRHQTTNQAEYIRAIAENEVVLCDGPAGSGKTHIAVGMACQYLAYGKAEKIVITRPVVEAGKSLGYLPGSFEDKIHPYLVPVLEFMYDFLGRTAVDELMYKKMIDVVPLNFMRGRTFNYSFMILDEAQNANLDELKLFITRMGRGTKCIINGDSTQSDLAHYEEKSFSILYDKLVDIIGVGRAKLYSQDIIRNPIISRILQKL